VRTQTSVGQEQFQQSVLFRGIVMSLLIKYHLFGACLTSSVSNQMMRVKW